MEKIENTEAPVTAKEPDGRLSMKIGRTTYNIGIHFNHASTESMEDKVKRLIQEDIKAGNF
ncbi:hypothetical protein DS742_00010 [Lacrimispora amygdalina]|uniref:Transposon-encoded protein TnpW n=1 Tax=Lacrimispora amygdalina TaxID=253257 RepID=A0A3E2NJA8_9FIRM|nr:transposon-encoded TnpW family protein [Clostridium indicum]RFZ81011.1 hypothetical protein DS742_00010 [Clostridium indicum]